MKKIFSLLCPLLFFAGAAMAQVQQQMPTDISKKFFEVYAVKPMDAIDYIFSGTTLNKQVKDDITAIKKNLKVTINKLCHCGEERRGNRELCIDALYSMRLPRYARNDGWRKMREGLKRIPSIS